MTQQRDGPSSASVERAQAERYKLRQRDIRRGPRARHGRARPPELESGGFSIPRLASGFAQRVGRLINGH